MNGNAKWVVGVLGSIAALRKLLLAYRQRLVRVVGFQTVSWPPRKANFIDHIVPAVTRPRPNRPYCPTPRWHGRAGSRGSGT